MIKVTKIFQLDSSELSVIIDTNVEEAEKALLEEGYEFNNRTGYYEKEDEMILLQEVE